jgi:hypothetical protein
MVEKIGRMTDSWRPSDSLLHELPSSTPHVHHHLELALFRDYYQDPNRETLILSQAAWDRKFRSWCARAERKWLDEHDDKKVRFDEVTGLPINPKKANYKEGR